MYLIYTDETGTNFSPKESAFMLYGGLVVHESKVNLLELQLQKMIAKFLQLDDIKKVELHTSEIFHILFSPSLKCEDKRKSKDKKACKALKELLENVTQEDFIQFTDELIQFLTKMNIPLLLSIIRKDDEIHTKHQISKETSALAYSFKTFLNLLDRYLASKNEKGLLIADDFSNQIPTKIRNLPLHERISDQHIAKHKELIFLRVLHRSLSWKTESDTLADMAPLKYEFESKNMFLIDNINYTNSKDSILNQVADFLLFIIRKTLEYDDKYPDNLDDNLLKVKDLVHTIKRSIHFAESSEMIQVGKLHKTHDKKIDINISCGPIFTSAIVKNIIVKNIKDEDFRKDTEKT